MVEVHIQIEKEIHLQGKGEKFRRELLNQLGQDGVIIMESVTPKRTARGANNYRLTKKGNAVEITNNTKYLPWVNEGTGIYGPAHRRITPKRASVLHFWWHGREWFVKSVRGQKPRRFVEKGVQDIIRDIEKATIIASNKTLR